MQAAIGTVIYTGWLGGFSSVGEASLGRLLTLQEVGDIFSGM